MYTQNQVRQLYVAKDYIASAGNLSNPGDITVSSDGNGVYFLYVGPDGKIQRSDRIEISKIMNVQTTMAAAMKRTTKATLVTLDSEVNEGNPIGGQDYELIVKINQMYWKSDYTWGYKYGVVHATSGMSQSNFYKKMALSLVANMSREAVDILNVYLVTDSEATAANLVIADDTTRVTKDMREADLSGTYYGIVIDEADQPWRKFLMPQEAVLYEVGSDEVLCGGDMIKWGVEELCTGHTEATNGRKIADMEYLYHGERGDIYREGAWPNNWDSGLMAEPGTNYDVVDIHYYWNGANHAMQKSEKDITIALVSGELSAFASAFNTAAGKTIVVAAQSAPYVNHYIA